MALFGCGVIWKQARASVESYGFCQSSECAGRSLTWNSSSQMELMRNPMPHSISYCNVCLA